MPRTITALAAAALWTTTGLSLAAGPPNYNAYYAAPQTPRARVNAPALAPALVASVDARRGVPAFLWAPRTASQAHTMAAMLPEAAARAHLRGYSAQLGLTPASLDTAFLAQLHNLGRGAVVAVFGQHVSGADVFRTQVKVLMDRNLDLVAIGGNLRDDAVVGARSPGFVLSEPAALAAALGDLYSTTVPASAFRRVRKTKAGYRYYDLPTPVLSPIGARALVTPARIRRVWFPLPDRLVPAFSLELRAGSPSGTTSDAYAYVIAADDGRLLYRENLTHDDAVSYRVWAETTGDLRPTDGPLADFTPHPSGTPDASYPDSTLPSLVTIDAFNLQHDPWLPPGATTSKGNNVDAYTDNGSPDGFSPGDTRATMTGPGAFDRVYDTTLGPQSSQDQKMAAVTQIFYTTNWLHDWWYDSGFNEAAGNAQADNYGRGGIDGDPLLAEAQDSAPDQRNNANMSPGADGESPRMQMFVWDGKSNTTLTLQPSNQSLAIGLPDFGPGAYDISADVALVDDGSAPATDACQPIVNNVSGKIALLDRGTCTFKAKAVAAQDAGAVGVILANNQPSEPPPQMGDGSPPTPITIPVMSITYADGAALKTALASGAVSASMHRATSVDVDGTIDNTVVAHEWGHYIHLRQVACGSPMCSAESEGWGDFFALHMVVREGDDLHGTFALSQYASRGLGDDAGYFGIRRYPYSTDLSRNPLTFKHIGSGVALPSSVPIAAGPSQNDNAEPHAAGEIWASMLFEAYVALLERSQGPNPPYTFEEARRRMGDYVEAGLKLAPADPSYTEQRDAILAAASASDPSDVLPLAEAFARRGAGTCAVSPPRDSDTLSGVVEDFSVQPNLKIVSVDLDDSVVSCDSDGYLDGLETGLLKVKVMNAGTVPLTGASAQVTSVSSDVTFPAGQTIQFGDIAPYSTAVASVQVSLASLAAEENIGMTVHLDAPTCEGKASLDVSPLVNYDEVAMSAASDSVETSDTAWAVLGQGGSLVWSRTEPTPGNHVWSGIDFPSPSDTSLASPLLEVSPTEPFVISFDHRYLFETSDGVTWDGAVVEVSVNGGVTWKDVSEYGDPGYTGTIGDPQGLAQNVLRNRQGYVDRNASFPAMDKVTIDLGTSLAGQSVRVRFRIGSDDAKGDFGWELDNISFSGITNTPFTAVVPDRSLCPNESPQDAGPQGDGAVDIDAGADDAGLASDSTLGADLSGYDAQGGGCGCSTLGGTSQRPWAAAVLLAGLVLAARRRRG